MRRSIRFLGLVLAILVGRPALGQTLYTLQNLGLAGAAISAAQGINNKGVAVGYVDASGDFDYEAFTAALFTPGIPVSNPGGLVGFPATDAYAINDAGQSVGWALRDLGVFPGPTQTHAVLFVHDTGHDLGVISGGSNSTAYGINALGVAVGYSDTNASDVGANSNHAALFAGGKVVDLGTYPGDMSSVAYAIDSAGTAVGSSFDQNDNERAVQFAGGRVTLLGMRPGDASSHANGINDQGQAVGWSTPSRGGSHAVIFAGGQVIDLGIFPGGTYSIGTAINNFGQVAGYGDTPTDYFAHALLFENGQVIDLGTLPGGQGSNAQAINDHGDVVGSGDDGQGHLYALEWTLAHRFVGPVRSGP